MISMDAMGYGQDSIVVGQRCKLHPRIGHSDTEADSIQSDIRRQVIDRMQRGSLRKNGSDYGEGF